MIGWNLNILNVKKEMHLKIIEGKGFSEKNFHLKRMRTSVKNDIVSGQFYSYNH